MNKDLTLKEAKETFPVKPRVKKEPPKPAEKPKPKKEDEVRPAKKPFPPIPKNIRGKRVNVKFGKPPTKERIETGKINVGKVDTTKPKIKVKIKKEKKVRKPKGEKVKKAVEKIEKKEEQVKKEEERLTKKYLKKIQSFSSDDLKKKTEYNKFLKLKKSFYEDFDKFDKEADEAQYFYQDNKNEGISTMLGYMQTLDKNFEKVQKKEEPKKEVNSFQKKVDDAFNELQNNFEFRKKEEENALPITEVIFASQDYEKDILKNLVKGYSTRYKFRAKNNIRKEAVIERENQKRSRKQSGEQYGGKQEILTLKRTDLDKFNKDFKMPNKPNILKEAPTPKKEEPKKKAEPKKKKVNFDKIEEGLEDMDDETSGISLEIKTSKKYNMKKPNFTEKEIFEDTKYKNMKDLERQFEILKNMSDDLTDEDEKQIALNLIENITDRLPFIKDNLK